MATGGHQPKKQGLLEPKHHPVNRERQIISEYKDPQNSNSLPVDTCINNWTGDLKGRKKSRGNPQREREQSLLMESPPLWQKKQHTPSSFSRTKITINTPTSERVALENLKQHMTFSDVEDEHVSTDGENSNEQLVSQVRDNPHRDFFIKTGLKDAAGGDGKRIGNRNNNMNYASQVSSREENTRHTPAAIVGRAQTGHQDLLEVLKEKQQQLENLRVQQEELSRKYKETSEKLMQSKAKDNEAKTTLAAVTANQQLLQSRFPTLQSLEATFKEISGQMSQDSDGLSSVTDKQLESNILGHAGSDDEGNSEVSEVYKTAKLEALTFHRGHKKFHENQNKKNQIDMLLYELQKFPNQSGDQVRNTGTNSHTSSMQSSSASGVASFPTSLQQSTQSILTSLPSSKQQWAQPVVISLPASQQQPAQPSVSKVPSNSSQQAWPNTSAPRSKPTEFLINPPGDAECGQDTNIVRPAVEEQEVQEKFRCVTEVREQLDNLRNLVNYYRDRKDEFETTTEREDTLHDDELDQLDRRKAQLQRLKNEREMFTKILNKLDILQNKNPQTESGGIQLATGETFSDVRKPGLNQTANVAVVTFASNDELFGKMRSQRILHEELQLQKRELEDVVRKTERQSYYSGNEDIRSETASMSTDGFSFPASADATMATWGGSATDNVDGIKDQDDTCDSTEEATESSDIRRPTRKPAIRSSYGRHSPHEQEFTSMQEDSCSQSLDQQQDDKYLKVDSFSQWFSAIEDRITSLTKTVETFLNSSKMGNRQFSVSVSTEDPHSARELRHEQALQLQNQSMMLICHQLVQTLGRQQTDIKHLQQQIQHLQLQVQAHHRHHKTSVSSTAVGGSLLNSPQPAQSDSTSGHCLQQPVPAFSLAPPSNCEQMHSPLLQAKINNMAPGVLLGNPSTNIPACDGVQLDSYVTSEHYFPWDNHTRPVAGTSGCLGAAPVHSSRSESLLQQNIQPTWFASNLRSQSTVNQDLAFKMKSSALTETIGHHADIFQPSSPYLGTPLGFRDRQSSAGHTSCTRSSKKDQEKATRVNCYSLVSSGDKKRPALNAELHETICAEVASLISKNENRPYFLLELFRDVQQIDSDRMRQRSLITMHKLVQSSSKLKAAMNPELEVLLEVGRTDAEGVLGDEVNEDHGSLYNTQPSPSGSNLLTRTENGGQQASEFDHSQDTVLQVSMLDKSVMPHLKTSATTYSESEKASKDGPEKQPPSHRQVASPNEDEVLERKPLIPDDALHIKQQREEVSGNNRSNGHKDRIITGQSERLLESPASVIDGNILDPRCKNEEEQGALNVLDAILASLGGMEELAGDESSVLDPDLFMS